MALGMIATDGYASRGEKQAWELTGDILQIALPVTAFITTFSLQDKEGSKQFLKGFIATEATVYALKYSIQTRRPNRERLSFPSGHTALAAFASGFIHQRYGLQYAIPAYAATFVVGYSRIKTNNHWMHDVIGGAAIALLYSCLFTKPYHYKDYAFYPSLTPKSMTVHCEKIF